MTRVAKYTDYDGELGKVENYYSTSDCVIYLVKCNECGELHKRNAKHIKQGIKSRECLNFRPHNYIGYTDDEKKSRSLQKTYGINLSEYNKMSEKQNKKCAICNELDEVAGRRLAVDHDHNTGDVRGLLCGKCNRGLGLFNDKIKILKKAINYLETARAE